MWKKFKLQTSFVIVFSLIIIISISIFYIYMNNYVFDQYKHEMIANAQQLNSKLAQQIDYYFDDLNQLSKTSVTNQNLVNDIKTLDSLPSLTIYDNLYFDRSFESHASYLVNNSSFHTSNVYIFGRQNQFKFSYGFLPLDSNFEKIIVQSGDDPSKLFPQNRVLFYIANENTMSDGLNRPSLSIIRAFSDLSGTILGYIEVQQDYTKLNEITHLDSEREVYIVSDKGELIFPETKVDEDTLQIVQQAVSMAGDGWNVGSDYYTSYTSPNSGMTTIIKHPNELLFEPLYTLQRTTLITTLSIAALTVLVVYLVTFSLTAPIRKLRATVLKLDYDNMKLFANFRSPNNEVNMLNDAFQAMIGRLKQAMNREILYKEQEMKARFSALQGQISPHFIHNVLYLISISAHENNNQEVIELSKRLSDMLRYAADSQYQKVTLEEEMEYTRNYLYLMQCKYEDFLTFDISLPEEAEQIIIPRLTIQPFVENAILHGFSNCMPPWSLQITCDVSGEAWELKIVDNGSGIKEEKLIMIRHQIEAILDDPTTPVQSGFGGLGIVNTVARLKLTYPDSLQFDIRNNPDRGVSIYVKAKIYRS